MLADLVLLLLFSCLDERRDDRRDKRGDLKLLLSLTLLLRLPLRDILLRPDSLSDLILSLLLDTRLLLLREPGLGDRLGVAVPGLGVRLLLGLGDGLLLLVAFVLRLALEFADP